MKQRVSITLTILFLASVQAFGQFSIPIQFWAHDLEDRILVVMLEEIDEKILKRKKREGAQAAADYQASVAEWNEGLQKLVPQYWPFGNSIEFKTREEVQALVDEEDERYVILDYRFTEEILQSVKVFYKFEAYALLIFYPEYGDRLMRNYKVDNNNSGMSQYLSRGEYIFKISMPQSFLNERDVKFAFHQFDEFIEKAKTEGYEKERHRFAFKIANFDPKNALTLKDKTLLIPQEIMTVEESLVQTGYPWAYEVMSLADIDEALQNDREGNYAYYSIIWSDKFRYWAMIIVDNATGEILAENTTVDRKFQFRFGVPTLGNNMITLFKTPDANMVINEEHIEKLNELVKL
ncbi:MAG TPA: hypothetical protein DCE41_35170 [Cytophagales bacterium]|nr:hypothetical protein [Cytophagales bacterium]HAA20341.1 hypothetical protein [Cytophagales bacterium]